MRAHHLVRLTPLLTAVLLLAGCTSGPTVVVPDDQAAMTGVRPPDRSAQAMDRMGDMTGILFARYAAEDGRIDLQTLAAVRSMEFDRLDADGDGVLTHQEAGRAGRGLDRADFDFSGDFSKAEFMSALLEPLGAMDRNLDGVVERGEAEDAIEQFRGSAAQAMAADGERARRATDRRGSARRSD